MTKIIFVIGCGLVLLAAAEIATGGRQSDPGFAGRLCGALLCDADQAEDLAGQVADSGESGAALRLRQLAVLNDAASPFRWCDLGQAWLRAGEVDRARSCFQRAQELGPRNPAILMQIANFHFELNEPREALERTAKILELVTEYNGVIFSDYSRFNVPLQAVLERGLPAKTEAAQAYLHFLFAAGDLEDTRAAWRWAADRALIDDALAAEHVNRLWEQKQFRLAAQSWASHFPARGGYPESNLIFNGGFEAQPTNSILDWQVQPVDGVQASRDAEMKYQGRYSMRLEFQGVSNIDYRNLSQATAATPGVYRFQAQVRTSALTTDEGIRFRIADAESPGRLDVSTEPLLGTTEWHRVERTFEVGAETRAIVVQVVRRPSLKFDNKIAGTLWMDSVSLVRK